MIGVGGVFDEAVLLHGVGEALDVLAGEAHVAGDLGDWQVLGGDGAENLPAGAGEAEGLGEAVAGGEQATVPLKRFDDEGGEGLGGFGVWHLRTDAEIGNCETGEEMGGGDDGGRVFGEGLFEVRVIEGVAKMGHRFPDGVVHEDGAAGDALVELSGDVAGLLFHPVGVVGPGLEECGDVGLGHVEDIDEDDWGLVRLELVEDGHSGVERLECEHYWHYDVRVTSCCQLGAGLADEEIDEGAERTGGEGEGDEGPGGEILLFGVVDHPEAGEEAGDDEVGEDLGAAPGLEVGGEDAPEAVVEEGFGGEDAEGGDDGCQGEGAWVHDSRVREIGNGGKYLGGYCVASRGWGEFLMGTSFAPLLKTWRQRRRLSQLELALTAGVSQRHVSFLESGRARPSREMILQLSETLGVPLRDRNGLLTAAGFAPVFQARALGDPEMGQVMGAVRMMLVNHEPFPAVAIDRGWNVVLSNGPFDRVCGLLGEDLLARMGRNLLRLFFHPEGIRPYVENWDAVAPLLWSRAQREAEDCGGLPLLAELAGYQDTATLRGGEEALLVPVLPLVLRKDGVRISLFTVIATFGTAVDVTADELRIESLFPADAETERLFRGA